ncbi:hypothetical protein PA10_00087 [Pseudomonas phage pPa_SNUABM_DT01]|nr:hypothetical protein PA10_00087 [Pseudomonas phage pPa_SNUABM_DT01]
MSKEQLRMMNADDKLIGEAGNPLTNLFRRVLLALELEPKLWNRKLTTFLQSPLSRVPKNAKDIGQERNNFNRAIAKRFITFKTFQKAIQIMGCVRYSMSITLEMRDGRKVEVSTGMIKNPYAALDTLQYAVSGKGVSPEQDNVDYDEDMEMETHITDETVGDMIHQIDDDRPVPFPSITRDPSRRARKDAVVSSFMSAQKDPKN